MSFFHGTSPSSNSPRPNIEPSMGNDVPITQSSISILTILVLGKRKRKRKKYCLEPSIVSEAKEPTTRKDRKNFTMTKQTPHQT